MKWNIFLDDPLRWAAQDRTGLRSMHSHFHGLCDLARDFVLFIWSVLHSEVERA
jgi:hypothetical protein